MDLIASHFLTGAILSLVLPIALLIAIIVYWTVLLRRRSHEES
jgi:protein-S-isoprenylcysteine O-methyltransferase Ste14